MGYMKRAGWENNFLLEVLRAMHFIFDGVDNKTI